MMIYFRKLALNSQLDTLNLTMCTGIDLDCCSILTGQMKQLRNLTEVFVLEIEILIF